MTENKEQARGAKRLYRSVTDRMIGGVCGGFAEYLSIDSTLVRIIWIIFSFLGFWLFGIIVYITCLVVMKENPYQDITEQKKSTNASLIIGVVLILAGIAFFSRNLEWNYFPFYHYRWHVFRPWLIGWNNFWPILIILIGILYIIHVLRKGKERESTNAASTKEPPISEKKFTRSRKDKMIGGVCGGIAEYLNIDPVLVRLLWILITFFSGFILGIIVYIVLLIVLPEKEIDEKFQQTSAPTPPSPQTSSLKPKDENKE